MLVALCLMLSKAYYRLLVINAQKYVDNRPGPNHKYTDTIPHECTNKQQKAVIVHNI